MYTPKKNKQQIGNQMKFKTLPIQTQPLIMYYFNSIDLPPFDSFNLTHIFSLSPKVNLGST